MTKYSHVILVSRKRKEYEVASKLFESLRNIQTKVLVTNESMKVLRFHDLWLEVWDVRSPKTANLLLNGMGVERFEIMYAVTNSP